MRCITEMLLLTLALAGVPKGVWAAQEIRVVGVGVSNSSMQAEEKALVFAKKRAIYQVARKMGVPNITDALATITPEQFKEIVRGSEILSSRRQEDTTYLDVNVSIVEEALRRALKLPEVESRAIDTAARAILVMPVFVGPDRPYLWEKENALRPLLASAIRRNSRGGVLLAGGDLSDLRLIDYQNSLTITPEELKPMFEHYGAEEIIIPVLTLGPVGTTDASNVLMRRLRLSGQRHEVVEIPVAHAETTRQERLQQAAEEISNILTQIATSTAEQEIAKRQQNNVIQVRFRYATPRDLAAMQAAVRAAPQVTHLDLPRIALAQVNGAIYFTGAHESLRQTLIKKGVVVTQMNEGWALSTR